MWGALCDSDTLLVHTSRWSPNEGEDSDVQTDKQCIGLIRQLLLSATSDVLNQYRMLGNQ